MKVHLTSPKLHLMFDFGAQTRIVGTPTTGRGDVYNPRRGVASGDVGHISTCVRPNTQEAKTRRL